MARSAGVEPATARFVAEYSIQLSYERKFVNSLDKITIDGKARNYRHILLKGQAIRGFIFVVWRLNFPNGPNERL